jgi:hypothetical protein
MNLKEEAQLGEAAAAGYAARVALADEVRAPRASAKIAHRRPLRWIHPNGTVYDAAADGSQGAFFASLGCVPDASSYLAIGVDEEVWNVKTNVGIDFIHTQSYGTAPAGNGLNYIALSDDTVTETATSTTLSNEIAANGLTRAQGAVAHTAGTTTTTVDHTFTCNTAQQKCQKAALFTAASNGTMNHVLGFTERTLQVGDTIDITYTLTIS